jgi:hypothetical protein
VQRNAEDRRALARAKGCQAYHRRTVNRVQSPRDERDEAGRWIPAAFVLHFAALEILDQISSMDSVKSDSLADKSVVGLRVVEE